jgi:hypothetical protein
MRWAVFIVLLGCAADAPSIGQTTYVTRACVRSFPTTLQAWEAVYGRVPRQCEFLDREYSVQLVEVADMPCPHVVGLVGCTEPSTRAMYLLRGRDDLATLDTSIHEWIHALSDCVFGDVDREHARPRLWDSIEAQAQASAEVGECL